MVSLGISLAFFHSYVRLLFLALLAASSCSSPKNDFSEVACDASQSVVGDDNTIFKPCRKFIYNVKFWAKDKTLVSDEQVMIFANGKPSVSPDPQDEIEVHYQLDRNRIEEFENSSINPEYFKWVDMNKTGIVEDDFHVWIHPLRENQYVTNEIIPFPEVQFPLEKGKTWNWTLNIYI